MCISFCRHAYWRSSRCWGILGAIKRRWDGTDVAISTDDEDLVLEVMSVVTALSLVLVVQIQCDRLVGLLGWRERIRDGAWRERPSILTFSRPR
jgi:hypothetical protein